MANDSIIPGRKIPENYENPIDNQLLYLADQVAPTAHRLGMTPNVITTLGLICRVLSLYFLYTSSNHLAFFILAAISYFFDCLDGHLARKYQQCTVFGDYYDHVGDVVYHSLLLYYLFFQSNLLNSRHYFHVFALLGVMALLMLIHFGCQESYFEKNGGFNADTLNFLKVLCTGPQMIKTTRYFGSGTLIMLLYLLVYLFAK